MADSSVAITPGTGANIDTATQSGGDHRQVICVGDPTGTQIGAVDSLGRQHVNVAGSGSLSASAAGSLTASAASTITGTSSTTGSVVADTSSAGNCSFHLLATAFVGTVTFEQSFDSAGGAGTWAAIPVLPEDGTAPITTLAISTAVAYIRQFTASMWGPALFRVRCSTFTSGTLVVLAKPGPGWFETQPSLAQGTQNIGIVDLGAATAGTTASVTLSGTANTNTTPVAADATRKGLVIWNNNAAAVVLLSLGATATTTTLYSVKLQPGQGYEVPGPFVKLAVNAQANVASATIIVTAGTGV